jgi:hypothetical protein
MKTRVLKPTGTTDKHRHIVHYFVQNSSKCLTNKQINRAKRSLICLKNLVVDKYKNGNILLAAFSVLF